MARYKKLVIFPTRIYGYWKVADNNELDYIRNNVLKFMDDGNYWEDEISVKDEDVSLTELITVCNSEVM